MGEVFPPDKVLISKEIPNVFRVSDCDTYVDIYTPEERDIILSRYQRPNLFNGPCIRLDKIENGCGYLSPVHFFDFLCCNIAGIHNQDETAWTKLKQYLSTYGNLNTFEKVLKVNELPNILGVSVLLKDINDTYLLVERNTTVSVGSGLFACSASGSMDICDLKYTNPLIACGVREVQEELNLTCTLYLTEIVVPIQKMHPIALLSGTVHKSWKDLIQSISLGVDLKKENSRLLLVPKEDLLGLISMYTFTDAATYHIYSECDGTKALWKKSTNNFYRISDYYIL